VISSRMPSAHVPAAQTAPALIRRTVADRSLILGMWLVAIPAGVSG